MLLKTFDRYVVTLFLRVAVICFLSATGLYCVIDAFNNMDELVGLGEQVGGLSVVLVDYYGPRVPWFFDRGSALVALLAAMFALHSLQRNQELTAVMAAGIKPSRVIRPLLIAAAVIALLACVNREVVLPQVRARLLRNAQDWFGRAARAVQPTTDNRIDVLLDGKAVFAGERRIEQPNFQLYQSYGEFGKYLRAANAEYRPAADGRPAGFLLSEVTEPRNPQSVPSVVMEGRPVILTPHDTVWLKPDQLFVASDVSFEQLASGSAWRRYSSTWELIREMRNPSIDFGLDSRVTIHSRFVQPLLDMTLFLLGLPLVLSRENRNIFVAVGWCFLVVMVFFLVVVACQGLGNSGYLLSPALAAWVPLFIFLPVAAAVSNSLWE